MSFAHRFGHPLQEDLLCSVRQYQGHKGMAAVTGALILEWS
jgi:hypothetical protein